ncbi:MAG: acyl-CoA thioesterase [Thermotogae bacterium]|nr:acyl-CoA thioesterase [Thermotogota bacterium]
MFKHRLKVRYAETDQMGVVHHSMYAVYFEEARVSYLEKAGYPYSRMEKEGILMPLLELKVRFLRPAFFEDILEIDVVPSLKGARLFVFYTVWREGEKIAEGQTVHAFTDKNLRPIRPPSFAKELFKGP